MMNSRKNNRTPHASKLREFINSFRQLMFPKEFRIAAPIWPPGYLELITNMIKQLEVELTSKGEEKDKKLEEALPDKTGLLADIATGLWRTRKNIVEEGADTPKDGMEKAFRHVQSVFDVLETAEMQIKDHTGEKWADGRLINVVAFQPMPELTEEIIIETIKPSIFFKDQHIQKAQVIVGTPPEND
ncbi:hypothetical protein MNBD_GAMMA09-3309 [hydrothermal vent metagenome]|uniref:Nucleotide exchange factor GrpE n=1 Tax=hydrothermal vent metagenome TaxID=652676 RepID=A0A3B0XM74_9ZZZZ